MKVPSEADLQELENRVLHYWRGRADALKGYEFPDRIVTTLETLISLARDPSALLRDIPDDNLIDRFKQTSAHCQTRTCPQPCAQTQKR